MSWWQAVILGLVQGITEILPVSSDGHLAVVQQLMVLPEEKRVALSAALHLGTALALLGYFAPRVWSIISGTFNAQPAVRAESWRLIGRVMLGCIPAVSAGLLFEKPVEAVTSRMVIVGIMLVINGGLLYATRFRHRVERHIGWRAAPALGLIQTMALLPGISRSGTTIGLALLLGIGTEEAFDFSFLLAIPLSIGAAGYELLRIDFAVVEPGKLALGIGVALVSGLAAIRLLRRLVVMGRLSWFGLYSAAIGIAVMVFRG